MSSPVRGPRANPPPSRNTRKKYKDWDEGRSVWGNIDSCVQLHYVWDQGLPEGREERTQKKSRTRRRRRDPGKSQSYCPSPSAHFVHLSVSLPIKHTHSHRGPAGVLCDSVTMASHSNMKFAGRPGILPPASRERASTGHLFTLTGYTSQQENFKAEVKK